ncbi:hypothetical protein B5X24_HaOG205868 [Helicoverpa armigera]|nr:hypothetical protein B5X24_HaOG205868 [Helicoverpa armigera]
MASSVQRPYVAEARSSAQCRVIASLASSRTSSFSVGSGRRFSAFCSAVQSYTLASTQASSSQGGVPARTHAAAKLTVRYALDTRCATALCGLRMAAAFTLLHSESAQIGAPYRAILLSMPAYSRRHWSPGLPMFGRSHERAPAVLIKRVDRPLKCALKHHLLSSTMPRYFIWGCTPMRTPSTWIWASGGWCCRGPWKNTASVLCSATVSPRREILSTT